jgi:hypothetical protein
MRLLPFASNPKKDGAMPGLIDAIRRSRRLFYLSGVLMAAACTTQEAPEPITSTTVQGAPLPQRSYLDAGPAPLSGGRPNYVRDNLTSSTRQTDFFGNDVLPRTP